MRIALDEDKDKDKDDEDETENELTLPGETLANRNRKSLAGKLSPWLCLLAALSLLGCGPSNHKTSRR